jgi:hypothetical protein
VRRDERGGACARGDRALLPLREGARRRLRHGQHPGAHAVPLRGGAAGRVLARRGALRPAVGASRRQDRRDGHPAVARRRAQRLRRVVGGVAGVRARAGAPAPRRDAPRGRGGDEQPGGEQGRGEGVQQGRYPGVWADLGFLIPHWNGQPLTIALWQIA